MQNEKAKKILSSKSAKSAVIIVAVLLIGLAVYLNYRWFYDPVGSLGYGDNNMDNNSGESTETGGTTDGAGEEENNYFSSTVLSRQQSRDEAIDVLKLVTENEESTEQAKADAADKISKIAVDIQNETNIETLVKAKGFEECVAVISDGSVSVIVKADELRANQAAQILTIVYETTGIAPENVSIINK